MCVSPEGSSAGQVGLALLVASCAGCMLLPAVIIIPAHLWRYAPLYALPLTVRGLLSECMMEVCVSEVGVLEQVLRHPEEQDCRCQISSGA